MSAAEIARGNVLAPNESIVWQGAPRFARCCGSIYHLPAVGAYFVLLFGADAYQAYVKHLPLGLAVYDSVPLMAITGLAIGVLVGLAWFTSRTTHYTVTDRRVILHYGIAMPATLAIPLSQIGSASIAVGRKGTGDIALVLRGDNHMPFLKLWPLARPWHVTKPQPMLRCVPQAGVVGGLLTRALAAAEGDRRAPAPKQPVFVAEAAPALLRA